MICPHCLKEVIKRKIKVPCYLCKGKGTITSAEKRNYIRSKKLKEYRESFGVTTEELAAALNIKEFEIIKVESGVFRDDKLYKMIREAVVELYNRKMDAQQSESDKIHLQKVEAQGSAVIQDESVKITGEV